LRERDRRTVSAENKIKIPQTREREEREERERERGEREISF
jgi:hypothetical protein